MIPYPIKEFLLPKLELGTREKWMGVSPQTSLRVLSFRTLELVRVINGSSHSFVVSVCFTDFYRIHYSTPDTCLIHNLSGANS